MISDEQLVERAQHGDGAAMDILLDRFEAVALWVAADYYDPSADRDDLRQEARIGLLKAARDYNPEAGASFRGFAFICIRRNVMTAVKAATRGKHNLLTFAGRVATDEHGEEIGAIDAAPDGGLEQIGIIAQRAQLETVVRAIRDDLSPLERAAVVAFVFNGDTYEQIVAGLRETDARNREFHARLVKNVDNALVRARRKLRFALAEADAVPLDVTA